MIRIYIHLRLENGELDIGISGPLIENFGLAFGEHCRKIGAKNYVEMTLHGPEGERYIVTFQRVGAQSPADMANEAKAALKDIVDCYGVGSAPEQFCENVRDFMERARGLVYGS